MARSLAVVALAFLVACGGREPAPTTHAVANAKTSPAAIDQSVVTGVVEAADGAPAADAVVAINRVTGEPFAIVHVDTSGRFRVPRPPERFAVTATSAQGTAAFVAPADAAANVPLRVRLQSAAEAFTIEGTVSLRLGTLPEDIFIQASRRSPAEGDLFYASPQQSGVFTLHLPPGEYSLRPHSERLIARPAEASGAAGEHAKVGIDVSLRGPAPEEIVSWLGHHALPIATTDVQPSSDDLDALAKVLAGARVIGIGEATHGTREYFRLKHRMLDRLVGHHGMTLLAMEANFSDAEAVDAWVQTGRGTVEDAMKSLFLVWRTEEVRDLLVWMRAWNANPRHRKKIRFRGYDVQGTQASMQTLRAYVRKVDLAAEPELFGALEALDRDTNERGMIALGEVESDQLRDALARLRGRIDSARRAYVARSSIAEYDLVMRHVRALEQALARFAAKGSSERFAARDRAMAENVVWLSEQMGKDERMMVWAHNGHIQLDSSTLLGANMGSQLRERLGSDYLAAGFVLDEGTYRAWEKPNAAKMVDVTVGPREPEWAADAFARVGVPLFAVDLRVAPAGPIRDWLLSPHVLHSCGWLVSEGERKGSIDVLGRAFDVAIYVGHTTRARQLPWHP